MPKTPEGLARAGSAALSRDGVEGDAAQRLTGLDALRGIAALLVMGYHLWEEFGVLPIFSRSYLAVDFFFMLSGYVMARTYEERLRGRDLSPVAFLGLRYHRLWAPIALGTLLSAAFQLAPGQSAPLALILGFLLMPNLGAERPYPLNRPAWSILFELFANAVHALVLCRLTNRALCLVLFSFVILLVAYSLPYDAVTLGLRSQNLFSGVPRVMVPYGLGILLQRTQRSPPSVSPFIAPILLLTSLLFVPKGLSWDLIFVVIACPVTIALGAREFGGRAAAVAGALSFPLYAVHFPVLELVKAVHLGPVTATCAALVSATLTGVVIDARLRRIVWPGIRTAPREPG